MNLALFSKNKFKIAAILLLIIYIAASGSFLLKYPVVNVDEASISSVAWNYHQEGNFASAITEGVFGQNADFHHLTQRLLLIPMRFFGMGLFSIRILSLIFGIILLFLTYFLAKELYDKRTGFLTAAILALTQMFIFVSHEARPDIYAVAFFYAAIYFFIKGRKNTRYSPILMLSCGLAASLIISLHANGLIVILSVAGLFIFEFKHLFFKKTAFWYYVAGLGLGVIYYSLDNIYPNPRNYFEIARYFAMVDHRLPILNPFSAIRLEVQRYTTYFTGVRIIESVLFSASLLFALLRRKKSDWIILYLIISLVLGFTLLVSNKLSYYLIYLYPLLAILLARMLNDLIFQDGNRNKLKVMAGIALSVFIATYFSYNFLYIFQGYKNYDYYGSISKIQQKIPSKAKILALPNYWIGLNKNPFVSSYVLTWMNYFYNRSLTDSLSRIKPDYIIVDESQKSYLVDKNYFPKKGSINIHTPLYNLPKKEFCDLLAKRAKLIYKFNDRYAGEIDIYRFDWKN